MSNGSTQVHCRQIAQTDIDAVVDLLATGFPDRSHDFWRTGLRRLAAHRTPPELPRFGYLLEVESKPVGVLLVLSSFVDGGPEVRCNVAAWFVAPDYRSLAPLLAARALRHKQATYLNVSPAPHTRPMLDALGYAPFCKGQFVCVPALNRSEPTARVEALASDSTSSAGLAVFEREVLRDHAALGCLSVVVHLGVRSHPFVFQRLRWHGLLPFARLIYCRSIDDFIACAGALGRHLASRGVPLVAIDSNGPIPGLRGRFRPSTPRYFKGTVAPRLGDLAYTEFVMFGI